MSGAMFDTFDDFVRRFWKSEVFLARNAVTAIHNE
jgi:hypothetical protein